MGALDRMGRAARRAAAALLAPVLVLAVLAVASPAAAAPGAAPASAALAPAAPVAAASPAPSPEPAPPEAVTQFVDDQLSISLQARYPDSGIDFTQTTPGDPRRVMMFTEDARAGRTGAAPLVAVGLWAVPLETASGAAGVAIVGYQDGAARVRLRGLRVDPALATAIAAIPGSARLVRDPQTASWFWVRGSTATVIAPGSTGLKGAVPLRRLSLDTTAPIFDPVSPTTVLLLGLLGGAIALVLLGLLIARVLRGRPTEEP